MRSKCGLVRLIYIRQMQSPVLRCIAAVYEMSQCCLVTFLPQCQWSGFWPKLAQKS